MAASPDIVVDVPGTGIVSFPGTMSEQDIEATIRGGFKSQPKEHDPFLQAPESSAASGVGALATGAAALLSPSRQSPAKLNQRAMERASSQFDQTQGGILIPPPLLPDVARQQPSEGAGPTVPEIAATPFGRVGATLTEAGRLIAPENPSVPSKIAGAGAGFLPALASGPLAPVTMGLQAMGETLNSQYEALKAKGLSDEEATRQALTQAQASGVAQGALWEFLPAPLKKVVNKVTGKIGGGAVAQFLTRRAAGAVEGATIGGTSQALQNVTSGQTLGANVPEAAGSMALIGAVTPQAKATLPPELAEASKVLPRTAAEVSKIQPQPTEVSSDVSKEPEAKTETTPAVAAPEVQATRARPATHAAPIPAIKVGGKIYPAEAGEADHTAIITRIKQGPQPDLTGMEEGFVNAEGKFEGRAKAAETTGLPTATEPGKLHSSDLPKSEPPPGQMPVTIKRADGKVYPAVINGYYDMGKGPIPSVGRWDGTGWSHGMLKPGEEIVTPNVTPETVKAFKQKSSQPATVPEAIKYRIGSNPSTWSLVEKLPQSDIEKANNEQPVRVKNDRTGEVQTVVEAQLRPVKSADKTAPKSEPKDLDAELRKAGMEPSAFQNAAQKRQALKRAKALAGNIPPGQGMGAMQEGEMAPSPTTPTAIKNVTVEQERASRGLPPVIEPARRSFGRVWDEAMAIVDHDPATQDNLIDELRDKPRALTDTEDALLLHRQIDLQNEYGKATRDLAMAHDDGRLEDVEREKIRVAGLSDRLLDLYNINKSVGTATGRGLNARKMMAYEDFSLAKMELEKRAAKGGTPLTDAERSEITKLQARIESMQKQLDTHESASSSRNADAASEQAVKDINADVSKESTTPRGKRPEATPEEVADSIKKRAEGGSTPPEVTNLIQKLAKAFVRRGIKERVPLVDAVHGVIKNIFPDMDWRQTMDAISGYGDFKQLSKDQIAVQLRDLKGQMQQASKLLDMFEKEPPSKTGFERRTPTDAERRMIQQVNEAKKRFGINTTDPASQLKSALASLKTRLRNQISDYEDQIAAKQKFVKERAAVPEDAESKSLREHRDKLKAEFDQIFGKPELSDEQRVSRALASLDRQSTELERQLKEGDIFSVNRASKTPSTPELEAARAKRDALKTEREYLRESIQPTPTRTAEERSLQALKTRLANRTAELHDRLAKGDFATRSRPQIKLDAEAMRLKSENQKAKDEFHQGLLRDRMARRTPFEKMQDTLVKWRRNFLLSGPVTLAKLTSAAAQRITTTPMEEAVGSGVSAAFPQLSERTTRKSGLNAQAESKAFTEGFTKGMADAWQTLKTGKSDLDRAYGRNDQLPREAIDFLGSIHGALKTVAKRNEFARSLEQRAAQAIDQGVDITDPMVQTRLAQEAYRDANRSIFMQDNRVVSAYKAGMARLLQPDKATGHVPTGRKVLATALNVALPIVKIPSNIVAETMEYTTGSVTGSFKLANAYRKGIENLPPEQADIIMRQLKKGSLGAAAMLIGYFNPQAVGGYYQAGQKRNPKDVPVGGIKLFGVTIPNYLLHSPLLETFQIGATIRRVADSKLHKKDSESQGLAAGVTAGALGLTEEVPFVREMSEVTKAYNPQERGAFTGELSKSIVIPQGIQWLAQQMDKNAQGQKVNRKPETALQHFETGIPGLRKNVPVNRKQPVAP